MILRVMVILTVFAGSAMAAGSGTTGNTPTLSDAIDLVESGDYAEALDLLEDLNRRESGNPDTLNMLGYASRQIGRFDDAFTWYGMALAIDPLHRGANEYLGELLLETGDVEKARERLAALEIACPDGCEERDELAEAIAIASQ